MASVDFPLMADEGSDDLPRTLRREREARERAAREREAKARAATLTHDFGASDAREDRSHCSADGASAARPSTRFDVSFGHLMMFSIKAVMAAIPALILLGVLMWCRRCDAQGLLPRADPHADPHHLPQLRRTRVRRCERARDADAARRRCARSSAGLAAAKDEAKTAPAQEERRHQRHSRSHPVVLQGRRPTTAAGCAPVPTSGSRKRMRTSSMSASRI